MTTKRLLFVLAAGVMALVTACGGGGSKAAQAPATHAPAAHGSTAKHRTKTWLIFMAFLPPAG